MQPHEKASCVSVVHRRWLCGGALTMNLSMSSMKTATGICSSTPPVLSSSAIPPRANLPLPAVDKSICEGRIQIVGFFFFFFNKNG